MALIKFLLVIGTFLTALAALAAIEDHNAKTKTAVSQAGADK